MTLADRMEPGNINTIAYYDDKGNVTDVEFEHIGGNRISIDTAILKVISPDMMPFKLQLGQFELMFLAIDSRRPHYIEYEIIKDNSKKKELCQSSE